MATFLDTNVLVYAFDHSDARKQRLARELIANPDDTFTLSSQVLSEFYWIATRKLRPALAEDVAEDAVRRWARVAHVVPVNKGVVQAAIRLARDNHLALWDAQLFVAARMAGCDELLTEDLNDGQEVDGIRIRNPFLEG